MSNNIRVIGHRGAAAYAPENTLISVQKASELGCKYIEFDVAQSCDGELFCFHDDSLLRTTRVPGNLADMKAEEIKKLDAGQWFATKFLGTGIPTLQDAIFWLNQKNMQANIEIKPVNGQVMKVSDAVAHTVVKYWSPDKPLPLLSSLNYHVLLFLYKSAPDIPLGYVLNDWPDDWLERIDKINCRVLNINKKIATLSKVKQAIAAGIEVNVFTVNRRLQAKKFFRWGVSHIFSDHPDLLDKVNLPAYLRHNFRTGKNNLPRELKVNKDIL